MEETILTIPGETINNISSDTVKCPSIMVTSCTVRELFSGAVYIDSIQDKIKGVLAIPEYQRPYVWGEKEISLLYRDLLEYFSDPIGEKPLYYLGSVILHREGGCLNIIDGQQRLTTLGILQSYLDATVPQITYVSPVSIQNIKRNYASIKRIAIYEEGLKNLDLNRINVTLVITQREDDAYTFFETQNTGGVPLNGVNIIKAFHLSTIASERHRGHYASLWEDQKKVKTVIGLLLKARYWGYLQWKDVPSDRDKKGMKDQIVQEFSQETIKKGSNKAYQLVSYDSTNGNSLMLPPYKYSIRQPLANGQNFIKYLECFCTIYERLFIATLDKDIDDRFYSLRNEVINVVDGTAFLKEFFEVALLCYVHRFGVENLLEGAYWIFRCTYAPRLTNQKTVREDSIPAFIRDKRLNFNHLFDHILASFNHEQLIQRLMHFQYEVDTGNTSKDTVKRRFIHRVKVHFDFESLTTFNAATFIEGYDALLQKSINVRLHGNK